MNSPAPVLLSAPPRTTSGFSLVEMMVALVLGLLVTGSAVGIFAANRRANLATDSLSRIQENARIAFELMARDLREAGGNPCGRNLLVNSVINGAGTVWWDSLGNAVRGYDNTQAFTDAAFGTGPGQRVAGTDAIEVKSVDSGQTTVVDHNPTAAEFHVNSTQHGLVDGDIAVVCDSRQVSVFQISNASTSNTNVVHNTGGTVKPGNCTKGLGFPVVCTANGTGYTYNQNAVLATLRARRWFIGNNPRGGQSLYQAALRNNGGTISVTNEEVTEGVTDMQVTYLLEGATAYVAATAVPVDKWDQARSLRVTLALEGGQRVGTDGKVLSRSLEQVVSLRNRLP